MAAAKSKSRQQRQTGRVQPEEVYKCLGSRKFLQLTRLGTRELRCLTLILKDVKRARGCSMSSFVVSQGKPFRARPSAQSKPVMRLVRS